MKTKLLIMPMLLILVSVHNAFTQEGGIDFASKPSVIVPPAPTASNLGKYGDIPVSLYTGTPQVNIPLYELKERDLSLPISLSYHASGIKVDDVESWVGLGWSLSAGGVITRSIRGHRDGKPQQGFWHEGGTILQEYLNNEMSNEEKADYFKMVAEGFWDTEPDVFHYSFNGRSGKLVFDHNKNYSFIPHSNLNVSMEMNGTLIMGFTITTEDGTRYVFNQIESSSIVPSGDGETVDGYTAWFLREIISSAGNSFVLSYENESVTYPMSQSETKKYLIGDTSCGGCFQGLEGGVDGSQYFSQTKRLTEIQSNNLVVTFVPGNQHSFGFYELDEIIVKRKGEIDPLKKYVFDYGSIGQRSKLESVQEFDKNGNSVPPYSFEYHVPNNIAIPPRLSFKQDHWGFYNSNPENTYLPEEVIGGKIYSGGSREPDVERSKVMMLKKMNYPTGGYTAFDFEAHDYGYDSSDEINERITETQPFQVELSPEEAEEVFDVSYPFSIEFNQIVTLDATWNVFERDLGMIEEEEEFSVSILKLNNQSQGHVGSPLNMANSFLSKEIFLEAGDYILYISHNASPQDPFQVNATVHKLIQTGTINKKIAGGARIKKMTDYDPVTNKSIIHSYEYKEPTTNRSSGVLIRSAKQYDWHYFKNRFLDPDCVSQSEGKSTPASNCTYKVRTSSNKTSLGTTKGSHIGYRRVSVYKGGGALGKTVYEYTTNVGDAINLFPLTVTSYDYTRGLPIKTTYYKSQWVENDEDEEEEDEILVYSPVKEVKNTYEFRDDANLKEIWAIKVAFTKFDGASDTQYEYEEARYKHVSQWFYRDQQVEKTYDLCNPLKYTKTITNYSYDNTDHVQLTSQATTNSNGQTFETKYKYPEDYDSPSSVVSTMITRNMVALPIEQIQKVDGQVISASGIEYQHDDVNDIIQPKSSFLYETTQPGSDFSESTNGTVFSAYNKRATFHKYDDKGNVLEYAKEDGLRTCYIWGYDQVYPIAQIVNATYSEVSVVLGGDLTLLNGNSLTEAQIKTKLSNLRNHAKMGKAQITIYTYKPGIGVSSITDPNGQETAYFYDDFGRLKAIKDHGGNVIQKNEYNYGN